MKYISHKSAPNVQWTIQQRWGSGLVLTGYKPLSAPVMWWLRSSRFNHYCDVRMDTMASQITSLTIVYSTVHAGADQRNIKAPRHWLLSRSPVNSPHKWPVTRKNVSIWWRDHEWVNVVIFGLLKLQNGWIIPGNIVSSEIIQDYRNPGHRRDPVTHTKLRPRQNGSRISDDIFKLSLFLNEIVVFWLTFHQSLFLRVQAMLISR